MVRVRAYGSNTLIINLVRTQLKVDVPDIIIRGRVLNKRYLIIVRKQGALAVIRVVQILLVLLTALFWHFV
jgi:hypothetical protein